MHVKPKTHTEKERVRERELSDLVQKPKAKKYFKDYIIVYSLYTNQTWLNE